jgi:hypothetical protein
MVMIGSDDKPVAPPFGDHLTLATVFHPAKRNLKSRSVTGRFSRTAPHQRFRPRSPDGCLRRGLATPAASVCCQDARQ